MSPNGIAENNHQRIEAGRRGELLRCEHNNQLNTEATPCAKRFRGAGHFVRGVQESCTELEKKEKLSTLEIQKELNLMKGTKEVDDKALTAARSRISDLEKEVAGLEKEKLSTLEIQKELNSMKDTKEADDKALTAARSRISDLEKEIAKLEKRQQSASEILDELACLKQTVTSQLNEKDEIIAYATSENRRQSEDIEKLTSTNIALNSRLNMQHNRLEGASESSFQTPTRPRRNCTLKSHAGMGSVDPTPPTSRVTGDGSCPAPIAPWKSTIPALTIRKKNQQHPTSSRKRDITTLPSENSSNSTKSYNVNVEWSDVDSQQGSQISDSTECYDANDESSLMDKRRGSQENVNFPNDRQKRQSKKIQATAKIIPDKDSKRSIIGIRTDTAFPESRWMRLVLCHLKKPNEISEVLSEKKVDPGDRWRVPLTPAHARAWVGDNLMGKPIMVLRVESDHDPRHWAVIPPPKGKIR